jgi:hypothetical protein
MGVISMSKTIKIALQAGSPYLLKVFSPDRVYGGD